MAVVEPLREVEVTGVRPPVCHLASSVPEPPDGLDEAQAVV